MSKMGHISVVPWKCVETSSKSCLVLLKGECCTYARRVLNRSFSMAGKVASLLPHVKYELTLCYSSQMLMHSCGVRIFQSWLILQHSRFTEMEWRRGTAKQLFQELKELLKPQTITIPLQYFFHWKLWFLMTPNWFFFSSLFSSLLCFNIKSMSLWLRLPESFVWCYKQIQPNIKIHKGDGGKHSFLKPHQVC